MNLFVNFWLENDLFIIICLILIILAIILAGKKVSK
jgi:hypothetical protein